MIAKSLDHTDASLILGQTYFERVSQSLGWSSSQFIEAFSQFMENKDLLPPNQQSFFAFLAELCELQFTLYKWGMILYNQENGLNTPVLMEFGEVNNPWHIVKNSQSSHLVLYDKELTASFTTSTPYPIVEALLFLYEKEIVDIRLVSADPHQINTSASIIALDFETDPNPRLLENLKHEFGKQKKRLETLQSLFNESF